MCRVNPSFPSVSGPSLPSLDSIPNYLHDALRYVIFEIDGEFFIDDDYWPSGIGGLYDTLRGNWVSVKQGMRRKLEEVWHRASQNATYPALPTLPTLGIAADFSVTMPESIQNSRASQAVEKLVGDAKDTIKAQIEEYERIREEGRKSSAEAVPEVDVSDPITFNFAVFQKLLPNVVITDWVHLSWADLVFLIDIGWWMYRSIRTARGALLLIQGQEVKEVLERPKKKLAGGISDLAVDGLLAYQRWMYKISQLPRKLQENFSLLLTRCTQVIAGCCGCVWMYIIFMVALNFLNVAFMEDVGAYSVVSAPLVTNKGVSNSAIQASAFGIEKMLVGTYAWNNAEVFRMQNSLAMHNSREELKVKAFNKAFQGSRQEWMSWLLRLPPGHEAYENANFEINKQALIGSYFLFPASPLDVDSVQLEATETLVFSIRTIKPQELEDHGENLYVVNQYAPDSWMPLPVDWEGTGDMRYAILNVSVEKLPAWKPPGNRALPSQWRIYFDAKPSISSFVGCTKSTDTLLTEQYEEWFWPWKNYYDAAWDNTCIRCPSNNLNIFGQCSMSHAEVCDTVDYLPVYPNTCGDYYLCTWQTPEYPPHSGDKVSCSGPSLLRKEPSGSSRVLWTLDLANGDGWDQCTQFCSGHSDIALHRSSSIQSYCRDVNGGYTLKTAVANICVCDLRDVGTYKDNSATGSSCSDDVWSIYYSQTSMAYTVANFSKSQVEYTAAEHTAMTCQKEKVHAALYSAWYRSPAWACDLCSKRFHFLCNHFMISCIEND